MATDLQTAVRRYRLLPENLPHAQQIVQRQQVIPFLLILAAWFIIPFFLGRQPDDTMAVIIVMSVLTALFLTYLFFVVPRRTRKILARCWETYSLEVGPDYLLRQQADTPDLRLSFSEIKRIERRPGEYLRVIGAQKMHVIGIPEDIEHFDEVWQIISALAPVVDRASSHFVLRHAITALFGAGFLTMEWSSSPRIVLPLAVALVAVLIWGIVERRINPNVSRAGKSTIWLYVWIMFLVALKAFTTLGQVIKR